MLHKKSWTELNQCFLLAFEAPLLLNTLVARAAIFFVEPNIRSWQSEPFPMGGAACCPFATTAGCDFSFCLSSSNDSLLPSLSFQGVIQDVKLIFAPNGYITQCPNLNRSKWSKRAPGVRPIFSLCAVMSFGSACCWPLPPMTKPPPLQ